MATGLLKMLMLHIIKGGEVSGYDLIKKVEAITGEKPSTGSIYPLLKKMEREGWVLGRFEDGKTYYSLTETGKEHIAQIKEAKHEFIKKIHQSIALANETFEDSDIQALMNEMHDTHRGVHSHDIEQLKLLESLIREVAELSRRGVGRGKIESILLQARDELKKLD